MSRSLKKGPYISVKLDKKVAAMSPFRRNFSAALECKVLITVTLIFLQYESFGWEVSHG